MNSKKSNMLERINEISTKKGTLSNLGKMVTRQSGQIR